MSKIPFGAPVQVTATYKRVNANGRAYWQTIAQRPRTGLCIGYRTLSNGKRWYEYEAGYVYEPQEYHRAMLVVFDERTKPVYVPLDAVEAVEASV